MKKVTDETWNVNDSSDSEPADVFNVASFEGRIMEKGWIAIPTRRRNDLVAFLGGEREE